MLKQWANDTCRHKELNSSLSDGEFIWFLSDCVMNILSGVLPINKDELKFEKPLRKLANRRVEKQKRKSKVFNQLLKRV